MTQTPYILWAVLATGLGIATGIGWIRCARMLIVARSRSTYLDRTLTHRTKERDNAKIAMVHSQDAACYYARIAVDAEDRLRKIEQARHLSAKHARQAQLSQQRAKVLEQASKLVAPKVDRIAA